MPTIDRINYLNIGLMVVSCVAAYVFPFELFLISYAVLGPLHYLTEISWLHERNYFTESGKGSAGGRAPRRGSPAPSLKRPNRAWLILVAVTMSILILGFVTTEILHAPVSPKWEITISIWYW